MAEQPRELLLQELLFKMRPFLESVLLENEDDSVGAARKLLAALRFLQRAVDPGMPLAQPSLEELVRVAVAELGTLARLGVAPGDFVKLFYMRKWLRRGLAQGQTEPATCAQEEPWAANSETDSSETADSLDPSQPEVESHIELSGVPPEPQVPAPVVQPLEHNAERLPASPARSWSCVEAIEMRSRHTFHTFERRLLVTLPNLIVLQLKGRRSKRVDEVILQSLPARRLREDGLTDEGNLRPEWARGAKILVKGFTCGEALELRKEFEIEELNMSHVLVEGDRAAEEVREVLRERFKYKERPTMKEVARRGPNNCSSCSGSRQANNGVGGTLSARNLLDV